MHRPFHFVTALWGARFVDLFVDLIIPTQLSAGNLPVFAADGRYVIYTTPADAGRMARHPAINRLRALMPVEFFTADLSPALAAHDSYEIMSVFHRHAVRRAAAEGAYLIMPPPDAIHADGSFRTVRERIAAGAELVLITGIRLTLETAVPALRRLSPMRSGVLTIPPRRLVDLAFSHRHDLTRIMEWGASRFNNAWPSQMFWFESPEAVVGHCWHLHPLAIRPQPALSAFTDTIDGDFVNMALDALKPAQVHIIQDSDEICQMELSASNHQSELLERAGPYSQALVDVWIQSIPFHHHRGFVRQPILYRGSAFRADRATALLERAQATANQLADLYEFDDLASVSDLRSAGRVFLYGAGSFGRAILAAARQAGLGNIHGFLATDQDGVVDNLTVHRFADYCEHLRQPDDLIVIASSYTQEIIPLLRAANIRLCVKARTLLTQLKATSGALLDFAIDRC